jgi:glycine/D-amino acid oxidase-like deaminating enzyme
VSSGVGDDDVVIAPTTTPSGRPTSGYADQPNRSPWIAQLEPDSPARPLDADTQADVVVVGAGIAGVATAFFVLRDTEKTVLLLERDRVARGATGRNAGQMTTYFERPLSDIATQFGAGVAAEAQGGFEGAHGLLEEMLAESGATVRVERFTSHLGLFNRHQLEVHLASELVRRQGGLPPHTFSVSAEAEFLPDLPDLFGDCYAVVPKDRVRTLLEVEHDHYQAVLSEPKGCANSGALAQQVLAHLQRQHPRRFRYADRTNVARIVVADDRADIHTDRAGVVAGHAVLCTNGFVDHVVQDAAGTPVLLAEDRQIVGRIAHMAAFVEETPRSPAAFSYMRNEVILGPVPYVYVTRRTYDRDAGPVTLTCMGGPEYEFHGRYDRDAPFPGELLAVFDDEVRPFAQPQRPGGEPYDFHWHGLMGYNDSGIRVVGAHPRHPRLLYNLGCNGVGFLPSLYGASRLARTLRGEHLEPSIFDPR